MLVNGQWPWFKCGDCLWYYPSNHTAFRISSSWTDDVSCVFTRKSLEHLRHVAAAVYPGWWSSTHPKSSASPGPSWNRNWTKRPWRKSPSLAATNGRCWWCSAGSRELSGRGHEGPKMQCNEGRSKNWCRGDLKRFSRHCQIHRFFVYSVPVCLAAFRGKISPSWTATACHVALARHMWGVSWIWWMQSNCQGLSVDCFNGKALNAWKSECGNAWKFL